MDEPLSRINAPNTIGFIPRKNSEQFHASFAWNYTWRWKALILGNDSYFISFLDISGSFVSFLKIKASDIYVVGVVSVLGRSSVWFVWLYNFSLCLTVISIEEIYIYLRWLPKKKKKLKHTHFSPCSADERFDATFHTNVLVNSSGFCQYIPPGDSLTVLNIYPTVQHIPF